MRSGRSSATVAFFAQASKAMRYKNLEPPYEPHDLGTVLKWMSRRRRPAPKRAEMRTLRPNLDLRPAITWIGHATWLLRMGGRSILTDPVWSRSLGPGITRNVPPPIEIG